MHTHTSFSRSFFPGKPGLASCPLNKGYCHQRADERLGDPPPKSWIQEPLVVRDRDGRAQEDPLAVHCFCVCSGSALLGDLLGVSRSMECDLLSVLSIYPRIFLHVFIVYRLLVGFLYVWLYSAICSCVLLMDACSASVHVIFC